MTFFKTLKDQIQALPELKDKFQRALKYAGPQKKQIIVILILTLFVAGVGAFEPLIMKFIFDSLAGESIFRDIAMGVFLLALTVLFKETFNSISNYFTWRVRLRIHYGLLGATVGRLHRLPIDFHRKQGVGSVMTKLERGIQGFVATISELSFNVIPAIFYLILAIFFMLQLDWRMTFLVLAFTPIPGIIATYAAPTQKTRERTLLDKWAKIYSRFNEVLSGIMTVKSFSMEEKEKKRFLEDVREANETVITGVRFDTGVGAVQNIVIASSRILAIMFGAYLVYLNEITIGTLIAFLGYIGALFGPVQGLTTIYKTIHTGSVSLEHIFSILDTQDLLGDEPDAIDVDNVKGEVSFENIYFKFNPESKQILNGISLHVKPGENIAIVGPSGSGKSTLMALLQRFYDPDEGNIFIDNINLKKIKQNSIRKNIGVVLQEALLFN